MSVADDVVEVLKNHGINPGKDYDNNVNALIQLLKLLTTGSQRIGDDYIPQSIGKVIREVTEKHSIRIRSQIRPIEGSDKTKKVYEITAFELQDNDAVEKGIPPRVFGLAVVAPECDDANFANFTMDVSFVSAFNALLRAARNIPGVSEETSDAKEETD